MRHLPALLFLFFGLLAAATPAHAQVLSWRLYGTSNSLTNPIGAVQLIKPRAGNGYLLGGGPRGCYLQRINAQGNRIWVQNYRVNNLPNGTRRYADLTGLAEHRSGNVLLTATGRTSQPPWQNESAVKALISGVDGHIIWADSLFTPFQEGTFSPCATPDGNFVLIGQYFGNYYLEKIDTTGRQLWAASVADSTEIPLQIVVTRHGYAVLANRMIASTPIGSSLRFYTKNGQLRSRQVFNLGWMNSRQPCLEDADGNLVVAIEGDLVKLDSVGNLLWRQRYRSSITNELFGVSTLTQLPDGHYAALGERYYMGQTDMVVLKIAPNGQAVRDTMLYRGSGPDLPCNIIADSVGNYVIYASAPSNTLPASAPGSLMLITMRGWRQVLGTGVESEYVAEDVGEVFPNPATTAFTLRLPTAPHGTYALRDALGRVVRQGTFSSTTSADASVSVAGLPAGLYLFTYVPAAAGQTRRTWRVLKAE
jgi:hypothetical protein